MSVLDGNDPRFLTEERRDEILGSLKGQPGVTELSAHVLALEERVTLLGQYYEEFLIPEVERSGWMGREARKRDMADATKRER